MAAAIYSLAQAIDTAKRCASWNEFRTQYKGVYNYCIKNKLLEEVEEKSGITRGRAKKGTYSKGNMLRFCQGFDDLRRLKEHKTEWSALLKYRRKDPEFFEQAVCHMKNNEEVGNYTGYLLSNEILGEFYVGITGQKIESRWKDRGYDTTRAKNLIEHELTKRTVIRTGMNTSSQAASWERETYEKLIAEGKNVVNDPKMIGHITYGKTHTEASCREAILDFKSGGGKTIKEFKKKHNGVIQAIYRSNGEWNYLLDQLERVRNAPGHWTKAACKTKADECLNRTEFSHQYPAGYAKSLENGWLDEFFAEKEQAPTLEEIQQEALKFTSRSEFRKNRKIMWRTAKKEGWIVQITQHMRQATHTHKAGYWTKERCEETAKTYQSFKKFRAHDETCLKVIDENGWRDELCQHIPINGTRLSFEEVKEAAKNCRTMADVESDYPRVFEGLRPRRCTNSKLGRERKEWREYLLNKLKFSRKPPGFWDDFENCKKTAKHFKNLETMSKTYSGGVAAIRRNGWVGKIKPFFKN